MTNPTNKIAIVTGASGGIGAAVAERLAKDGFTVVVNYAGNTASAEALVAKIEAAGGRAVTAQADIADAAAVARMFDTAEATFGGVDVLVNNAGIMQLATIGESDGHRQGPAPLLVQERGAAEVLLPLSGQERPAAGHAATIRVCDMTTQAGLMRTIGRWGLRRATSLKPTWSYMDLAPNHM